MKNRGRIPCDPGLPGVPAGGMTLAPWEPQKILGSCCSCLSIIISEKTNAHATVKREMERCQCTVCAVLFS